MAKPFGWEPHAAVDRARARLLTRGEARLKLLRSRRISLSQIARDLGKNLSAVSRVNRGERRSREIEQEIARRLDLSPSDAFPEWYRPSAFRG
jgi:transcriptional regulator with XRE-family HTH domain